MSHLITTRHIPKNRFARFSLLMLLMWLLVSAYFYFQHYRIDKVIKLDKEVRSGNNLIGLKELRLINYKGKNQADFSVPWYFHFSNNLPEPLRYPFINVCSFYTPSRYMFSDEIGTLSLSGYVISPSGNFSINDFNNVTDIWLSGPYEAGYIGGHSVQSNSPQNNFLLFSIQGNNVPLNTKEISIIIDDKISKQRDKITLHPIWNEEAFSFFNRKQEFRYIDPEIAVKDIINLARKNRISDVEKYVLPEKQTSFQWKFLSHQYWQSPTESSIRYVGNHLGYENVISSSFVFGEFKESNFKGVAKQEFFLIDTKNGWKVIDVSPIQKL